MCLKFNDNTVYYRWNKTRLVNHTPAFTLRLITHNKTELTQLSQVTAYIGLKI